MRVQIKPGLRQVRRGPGVVQIGVDPARAAVLAGLTAQDEALLSRLVEGLDVADVDTRPARARRPGSPVLAATERSAELLRLLAQTRVLVRERSGRAALARLGARRERLEGDAATWSVVHQGAGDGWELLAARGTRSVLVLGAGRTAGALALALAAGGIGAVRLAGDDVVQPGDVAPAGPEPADVGTPWAAAVASAAGRLGLAAVGAAPSRRSARHYDVVVLVDHGVADARRAVDLMRTDVPHLSVVVREASIVIGPLVVPGQGACLRCLDLHRTDRDAAWPRMLAQLLGPPHGEGQPAPTPARGAPEETASALSAAGIAALQVFAHVDGLTSPTPLGATLEVELPDGLMSRRPWPVHPACGCTWPPE